ncbi:formyltransferase family protein [uncultured Alistipes sp.]|uniref:formyltransferase family protein n=1 Tax=uncultured Alistipes sp. TaxID=538949 RepID=UPI0025E2F24F|nr:formyltransferase family protein [uncultured Alistipes sp.]
MKLLLKSGFDLDGIAFVLTDNVGNRELESLCEGSGTPFFQYSYQNEGLTGNGQNEFISNKLLELMDATSADYCFAGGARILKGDLLTRYENRLINIHPAILPAYKGRFPVDRALADKALLLGNTAHFINEEMDAGPVIMQNLILRRDYVDYDTVLDMQVPMLMQIIVWLREGRIGVRDNEVTVKDASYEIGSFIPRLEEPVSSIWNRNGV